MAEYLVLVKSTSAIEAGISEDLWTIAELVGLLEA
jgi:hypothetical protein